MDENKTGLAPSRAQGCAMLPASRAIAAEEWPSPTSVTIGYQLERGRHGSNSPRGAARRAREDEKEDIARRSLRNSQANARGSRKTCARRTREQNPHRQRPSFAFPPFGGP